MSHSVLVIVCALMASACATQLPPERVESLLSQTLRAAETHHESGMDPEAALLLDAVLSIDAEYPGAARLDEALDPASRLGIQRTALGMNQPRRPRLERTPLHRRLLWLPDRALDLMDVVTVGIHFGPGAFVDVHATRAAQIAGGFRATGGVGLHDRRSLGLKSQAEAGLHVLPFGTLTYAGALVGTSGTWSGTSSMAGFHEPTLRLYDQIRDYWALGASATIGLVGFELDVHPLQLADFFGGIAGIDFLNDDFAHTRSLRIDAIEAQLLVEIARIQRSRRTLEAYAEMRRSGRMTSASEAATDSPTAPEEPGDPSKSPAPEEGGTTSPLRR